VVIDVAQPWWVNLVLLIPPLAWFSLASCGVPLTVRQLALTGVFAVAFGFLEAIVVVYLRAAAGLLPDIREHSRTLRGCPESCTSSHMQSVNPKELLTSKCFARPPPSSCSSASLPHLREIKRTRRNFLWTFAIWDIVYYAGLWASIGWPLSLRDPDVLFLFPVPWFSPVWFPILVSALALVAVLLSGRSPDRFAISTHKQER